MKMSKVLLLFFLNVVAGFSPATKRARPFNSNHHPRPSYLQGQPPPTQTGSTFSDDETVQREIEEYLEARQNQKQIEEYLRAVDPSVQQDDVEEDKNLMQKIKDSGIAGIISFGAVQLAFWTLSVPVLIITFIKVTGHIPDFNNQDDLEKLGVEAFAYLNIARLAAPFRIGLSLSLVPWIQANIVERFLKKQ